MQIKITQLQWTGNIITKQNAEAKAETFGAGRIAGLMMWILILQSLGNDRSLKDVTEWWRMWSFTQLESRWKNFSFDFHSSNFWATVPAENKSDCEGKSSFEQRSYFFAMCFFLYIQVATKESSKAYWFNQSIHQIVFRYLLVYIRRSCNTE